MTPLAGSGGKTYLSTFSHLSTAYGWYLAYSFHKGCIDVSSRADAMPVSIECIQLAFTWC